MHYLIDGHNLIGKLPDIDLSDPNDEVKLVLKLRQWTAKRRKRRVTVYFDGGLPGGKSRNLSSGPVKVVFASSGKTADALLISQLRKVKDAGAHRLVTSDMQIVRVAKQKRVGTLSAENFAAQLATDLTPKVAKSEEADEPQMSDAEVAEWLELFGPVPERKPKPKPKKAKKNGSKSTSAETPKPAKRHRKTLDGAKDGSDPLDNDELDEWLKLFGQ